ncbi:ParA family protein [Sulfolobus sp. E1]|nr:ParA family protein [Sulfolobus sp. E1]
MKVRVKFIGTKGGVGKTTLALNTAFYLSRKYKVLFLDMDLMSLGSLILGFKGVGFYKAISKDLGEEEYLYNVNESLDVFKMFGDPIEDKILHNQNASKAALHYTKVLSRGYDVIIADYGVFGSLVDEPVITDEIREFKQRFPNYVIGAVAVTDPIYDDVIITGKFFNNVVKELNIKPIAFVINMIPEVGNIKEELEAKSEEIRQLIKNSCPIFEIPFKEEFLQYKNLGKYEEMIRIGKIIEDEFLSKN